MTKKQNEQIHCIIQELIDKHIVLEDETNNYCLPSETWARCRETTTDADNQRTRKYLESFEKKFAEMQFDELDKFLEARPDGDEPFEVVIDGSKNVEPQNVSEKSKVGIKNTSRKPFTPESYTSKSNAVGQQLLTSLGDSHGGDKLKIVNMKLTRISGGEKLTFLELENVQLAIWHGDKAIIIKLPPEYTEYKFAVRVVENINAPSNTDKKYVGIPEHLDKDTFAIKFNLSDVFDEAKYIRLTIFDKSDKLIESIIFEITKEKEQ